MTLTPCSSESQNDKLSTKTPRLEDMCEENIEGFPVIYKRRRVRRARRRTEGGLEALARVAEVFGKVAKERVDDTIITSDSIKMPETPKGGADGRGQPIALVPPTAELPSPMYISSEPSIDDLVDFRGLAMVPRCYASLLERACISHPDLAICSKKSFRWRDFTYSTLGEPLFFLTLTKRREMTQKACEHLQILWEDAQDLCFDLSWLAPIMESDLGSISDMENICLLEGHEEVVKERRNKLHCQLTTLTMQSAEAEKELADLQKLLRLPRKS